MTEQQPDERQPDGAHLSTDRFSRGEIGKDAVQQTVEAAASAVGEVAVIITNAVRDVATAIGNLASEVFEIQESSKKASETASED